MDIAAWILSTLLSILSLLASLVWFLISGWVSTILQVAVLIVAVYGLKYGWRRAPFEIWRRTQSFGRFFWNWVRAKDFTAAPAATGPEIIREIRVREFGDINISTAMSLAMLVGLALVATI